MSSTRTLTENPNQAQTPFCDHCHDRRAVVRTQFQPGCDYWCAVCFAECFPVLARLVSASGAR
jgi:hypothetical protein